jgi:hypothetical protein
MEQEESPTPKPQTLKSVPVEQPDWDKLDHVALR